MKTIITTTMLLFLCGPVFAQKGYQCRKTGATFRPNEIYAHAQTLLSVVEKDSTIQLRNLDRYENNVAVFYDSSYVVNLYYREIGTGKTYLSIQGFIDKRFEENHDQLEAFNAEATIKALEARIKVLEAK